MSTDNRLSIIIAVFNGQETLQKTLDSIRIQKVPDVELLVIDGKSTDSTMEIVHRNDDLIDYYVSEPDSGIYSAWNKGIAASRGEWIAFIGADDWYSEGGIATYLDAIVKAGPGTELISSRVRYHPLYGAPRVIGKPWAWPSFQRHMTLAHVGAAHRRDLYRRVGHYDETYRICADYELLLRARESLRAEFIPKVTAEMGGGGVSNNQLARTYAETCRAKHEAGGRSLPRCNVERVWDHFRAIVKRKIANPG